MKTRLTQLVVITILSLLASCGSKKQAVARLQINVPDGTSSKEIIKALLAKSNSHTSIKQISGTTLFEVKTIGNTTEEALKDSESTIFMMRKHLQTIHPDWKVIIWNKPEA